MNVVFCGIELENPFILAAGPPTASVQMIARAFEAGWAGAVTKTLFVDSEMTANLMPRLHSLSQSISTSKKMKYLYALENVEMGSDKSLCVWANDIEELRIKYPKCAIVTSIMSISGKKERWQELAKRCQDSGAQAIEVNVSCPHGGAVDLPSGVLVGQNPDCTAMITSWVKEVSHVPIIVKLTPNVSDIVTIGCAAKSAGADALSAINTVKSIIGVDVDSMVPLPTVEGLSAIGGLSGPAIKPIALHAIAKLAQNIKIPISGIGGIANWYNAVEYLLLGASTVQICTEVMLKGYSIIDDLKGGLKDYLKKKSIANVSELVGKSLPKITEVPQIKQSCRLVAQIDSSKCILCNACLNACRDGGGQAITIIAEDNLGVLKDKCVGCSLCKQVCPIEGCINLIKIMEA